MRSVKLPLAMRGAIEQRLFSDDGMRAGIEHEEEIIATDEDRWTQMHARQISNAGIQLSTIMGSAARTAKLR
jgi:hypothetical protein